MTDRIRVVHPEGGNLMTKQSMAAQTDVNQIMARWIHHGIAPIAPGMNPTYGDFSSGLDFQTALNAVKEAEAEFLRLPSHIRKHCHNDPKEFLELVYDPDRMKELVDLGLLPDQTPQKPAEPEPAPAPPIVAPVP